MSDCGNCDCADKTKCVKKGNGQSVDVMETEMSHFDVIAMDVQAAEHNGKCNCSSNCGCVDCTCGH